MDLAEISQDRIDIVGANFVSHPEWDIGNLFFGSTYGYPKYVFRGSNFGDLMHFRYSTRLLKLINVFWVPICTTKTTLKMLSVYDRAKATETWIVHFNI